MSEIEPLRGEPGLRGNLCLVQCAYNVPICVREFKLAVMIWYNTAQSSPQNFLKT